MGYLGHSVDGFIIFFRYWPTPLLWFQPFHTIISSVVDIFPKAILTEWVSPLGFCHSARWVVSQLVLIYISVIMSDAHIFKHHKHIFCQLFLTYFFFLFFFCSFKFWNQLQITSAANTLFCFCFLSFFSWFLWCKSILLLLLIWLNTPIFLLLLLILNS